MSIIEVLNHALNTTEDKHIRSKIIEVIGVVNNNENTRHINIIRGKNTEPKRNKRTLTLLKRARDYAFNTRQQYANALKNLYIEVRDLS